MPTAKQTANPPVIDDWKALPLYVSLSFANPEGSPDSAVPMRFYLRRPVGAGYTTFSVDTFTGSFIVPCRDGALYYYPWDIGSSNTVLRRVFAEGIRIPSLSRLPVHRPIQKLPANLLWDLSHHAAFGLSLFSFTVMALPAR